jgi:hypothetical protein
LLLGVAVSGHLFELVVRRFLWPAAPAAVLISAAVLWRSTRVGAERSRRLGPAVVALSLLSISLGESLRPPPQAPSVPANATGGARVVKWIPRSRLEGTRRLAPGVRIEGPLPGGDRLAGTVLDVRRDYSVQMERDRN